MKVKNKVIVVTGGGSGIARQTVLQLLEKGSIVVTVDINEKGLEETKTLAGENAKNLTTYKLNITDLEAVRAFYQKTLEAHGHIDGLINIAGIIQKFEFIEEMSYEQIKRVMDINFYGTLYMVKEIIPHLKTREEAHILDISSMGGFLPVPGQTAYGASKAAVRLLTEGLYSELKDTNIGVTTVLPGGVRTAIAENASNKVDEQHNMIEKILLTPEKCASIIIKSVEKNKFRVFAGKDSKLMNFIYKRSSKRAIKLISNQLSHNHQES